MKRILNNIKHLIYRRKELKRLKLCLKVIKNAKNYYIEVRYFGMCNAFAKALYDININNDIHIQWLILNIPEFNAKYLTGSDVSHNIYWWDSNDCVSRIKAFDKLIDLYKTKIKEL